MSASDERTLVRITADQLLAGDRIESIARGEMGSAPRFTVKRMVERVEGWYVVTEAYRGRERALHWHGDRWHENTTGPIVEVDERNATTQRLAA